VVIGIISSLVSLALPIVLVVLVVRYVSGRQSGRVGDGHGVRRFFQYLLLYGLLIVAAVGLTDLLSLLVDRPDVVAGAATARALTFVVIGIPIFLVLVTWTRRTLRSDPEERRSLGWAAYLTIAGLTAVVVAAASLHDVVAGALVDRGLDAPALVRLIVWGAVWALHWALGERTLQPGHRTVHLFLGSLIGLATSLTGLIALLGATLDTFVVAQPDIIVGTGADLGRAAAVAAAGVPIWVAYWLLRWGRAPASPWWLGYVLPVGVGVCLVLTVGGASLVLYRVLVWLVGEPDTQHLDRWIEGSTTAAAVAVVGGLSWWYHRQVFAQRSTGERTEVTRVYEYLLAGVALLAAATGVTLVVVAVVEAVAPPRVGAIGFSLVNAVLAAVTLLVVGGSLWWTFWRRIVRVAAAEPVREAASPTRRAYLLVLFGVAGVVAVVAVLVAAYLLIDDALQGHLGAGTLRDVRVPLGLVVATATISAYHWVVYRADRRLAPPPAAARLGPRQVVLVGPPDEAVAGRVRRSTGGRVEVWPAAGPPWDPDRVVALLAGARFAQVVVVDGADGPWLLEAGAPLVQSAPDAGQHGDQPGPGGEQGKA